MRKGEEATDSIKEQFEAAAIAKTDGPSRDILVNNAGIAPAKSLAQTTEAAFDELITIDLKELRDLRHDSA